MKNILTLLIAVILVGTTVPTGLAHNCLELPPGAIAWWPMDDSTGTNVEDIVGNNPGIQVNGPVIAEGKVGNCLRFDGSNDYVGAPDNDLWAFGSSDFTIELWANWDASGGGTIGRPGDIFIGNDEGGGTRRKWFFALGGGYLNFHINGPGIGAQFFPLVPFSPVVGQWYHLAVTRDVNTYTIYVNGEARGSAIKTFAIPNANAPLTIGQAENLGYMSGRLDEITIYNRALSQGELSAIYLANSAGKCKLTITTRRLSAVTLGKPFTQELRAIGGEPPYTWSLTDGLLPAGVSFGVDGILSGTPEETGEFTFTARVTDSDSRFSEKTFVLRVLLILPPPNIRVHKTGTAPVPGREIDYFILVENTGDVIATDIEVFELLNPNQFTLIDADPSPAEPIEILADASIVLWNVPSLAPGAIKLLTYRAILDASTPLGTVVIGGPVCASTGNCDDAYWGCFFGIPSYAVCAGAYFCFQGCFTEGPCVHPGTCALCLAACAGTVGAGCAILVYLWIRDCVNTYRCGPCAEDSTTTQGAIDPNEKAVIADKYIQPDQRLVYPIHFENIGAIEARDVFVTDVLDSNLDISTLEILTPDGSSFDAVTRTVSWELLNINLQPGATGNVLFSIRPLPDLPSGTEIRNTADIQFEVFDIYTTNEVVNIIDAIPPVGTMNPLPADIDSLEFPISWSGTDPIGEVESYSILVSVDGNAFTVFLDRTRDTSAVFSGENGKTYGFICIAIDVAGNVEIQEPVAEATTTVQEGSGVEEDQIPLDESLPKEFSLAQNYPNPFNPVCEIKYALPTPCRVSLNIYNILGQKVRVLVDEYQSAGHKSVKWDGKDEQGQEVTSCIYFYRIQAGAFSQSKKMVLLR